METIGTYKAKINTQDVNLRNALKEFFDITKDATKFLMIIIEAHYKDLRDIPTSDQTRKNIIEHMVHKTDKNPEPLYPEFDDKFFKMPSYLRRALIAEAWGQVSSYHTRHEQWAENGKQGKTTSIPTQQSRLLRPLPRKHVQV